VQSGHKDVARLLLDNGADIHAVDAIDGKNALHYAAGNKHTHMV
jgi:ankyrin repeat protein